MSKHTPGPYISHGSSIYASTPQDVDHSTFKGFDTKEPYGVGYLIAESIPHVPTRHLLAAAPDLLEVLEQVADYLNSDTPVYAGSLLHDAIRAAIAAARGEG